MIKSPTQNMNAIQSTVLTKIWVTFVMLSSPIMLSNCILQCHGFTFSLVRNRPSPPNDLIKEIRKSQSKEDEQVQQWFTEEAGVLGTSRFCLSTTEKSVGGRGLFWTSDEPAYQGDIVAFIPSKNVITSYNLESSFPELKGLQESEASWQAKMTTLASNCLQSEKEDYMNRVDWIKSWYGGGPTCPRPSSSYSMEELNQLAEFAGSTVEKVEIKIEQRYGTFIRDYARMIKEKYYGETIDNFGDMYSITVSRTACLGPVWDNKRGIIPVHDFMNHPPSNSRPNVELFCFGDLRKMIGFAHATELLKRVMQDPNEIGSNQHGENGSFFEPRDTDILLVASRDIGTGSELWLSYRDPASIKSEEDKIWLMLQYGFPLHAA